MSERSSSATPHYSKSADAGMDVQEGFYLSKKFGGIFVPTNPRIRVTVYDIGEVYDISEKQDSTKTKGDDVCRYVTKLE